MNAASVLVAVASRHDATREIAEALGARLGASGLRVRVVAAEEVDDVSPYDAVVLGSAVYIGRWLAPARELVARHRDELVARPVWLFSSGPLGDPPHPRGDDAVDVSALADAVGARGHRILTGRLERGRLGLRERAITRAVRAPEGDYRDWAAVDAYADEIVAELDAA